MVVIPLLVLEEESVEGEFPFFFGAVEGGLWESKARQLITILSVRSEIVERREGMSSWRCWILGLPGSSYRIEQMDVRVLSM